MTLITVVCDYISDYWFVFDTVLASRPRATGQKRIKKKKGFLQDMGNLSPIGFFSLKIVSESGNLWLIIRMQVPVMTSQGTDLKEA